jgi:hypothetical protein
MRKRKEEEEERLAPIEKKDDTIISQETETLIINLLLFNHVLLHFRSLSSLYTIFLADK